jgi:hypothetical protein
MAQSRVIVDDMRRALREVMVQPAETASNPKEPARARIFFARTLQEIDRLRRRAERRKALGLEP